MRFSQLWPKCILKDCEERARYWGGLTHVHVVRDGKIIDDGIWFFCKNHVPNPNKWFWLTAEDVREYLKDRLQASLVAWLEELPQGTAEELKKAKVRKEIKKIEQELQDHL